MTSLLKNSIKLFTQSMQLGIYRQISIFPALRLKEIKETKVGNELVIEGVQIPSPREQYLVKIPEKDACPVCSLNLNVKHTDVLILSQFVRSDGCMLPRRITGLCKTQQKRIGTMVTMAQKAGLMPNLAPANSKKDPKQRYRWKKCNTYFDENTIGQKKKVEKKRW
ncbi:39S ribosomal protein S18a, mitochondrial [Chrysoperla carnea]|uniref:39S ribosomal protein S18a, mitochondrial n=1 Tax=Chrysoperla carnea TaxID=189513 RepID=UPI001D0940D2|nr:39S ribosomal protein S18a, mitochondrial [Chrysoperla carnea]